MLEPTLPTATLPAVARPRYIYVNDQGAVFSSADEPTREDLRFAEVGMLTIISLPELKRYGTSASWEVIPPAALTRPRLGKRPAAFHALPPSCTDEPALIASNARFARDSLRPLSSAHVE
ncbi:hypothetical protein [Opitutus terrae]|uniref:Uncharacterized protein n=1 Tax=Opitutus terrae (strain DSM 11246 / JCM 15787 / PB90-1) TaxID=452637 RepID=B1ZMM4_OPITP|nr:hypothetical protein [Opitutus terrae]ACB74369.1 hypothetical protein Oter_1081 [Opitutus terrae PB90-1]